MNYNLFKNIYYINNYEEVSELHSALVESVTPTKKKAENLLYRRDRFFKLLHIYFYTFYFTHLHIYARANF